VELSEAIREGAKMVGPQLVGLLFGNHKDPQSGGCAMGAALTRRYGWQYVREHPAGTMYRLAAVEWPVMETIKEAPCGCESHEYGPYLVGAVVHLNNDHQWTREAIAEWVEVVEKENANAKVTTKAGALQPAEGVEASAPSEYHQVLRA